MKSRIFLVSLKELSKTHNGQTEYRKTRYQDRHWNTTGDILGPLNLRRTTDQIRLYE